MMALSDRESILSFISSLPLQQRICLQGRIPISSVTLFLILATDCSAGCMIFMDFELASLRQILTSLFSGLLSIECSRDSSKIDITLITTYPQKSYNKFKSFLSLPTDFSKASLHRSDLIFQVYICNQRSWERQKIKRLQDINPLKKIILIGHHLGAFISHNNSTYWDFLTTDGKLYPSQGRIQSQILQCSTGSQASNPIYQHNYLISPLTLMVKQIIVIFSIRRSTYFPIGALRPEDSLLAEQVGRYMFQELRWGGWQQSFWKGVQISSEDEAKCKPMLLCLTLPTFPLVYLTANIRYCYCLGILFLRLVICFILSALLFLNLLWEFSLVVFLQANILINYNLKFKKMESTANGIHPLSVNNFRAQLNKLLIPHKQKIQAASNHFKQKYHQYKSTRLEKKSIQCDNPLLIDHQRSPSYLSETSWDPEAPEITQKQKVNAQSAIKNKYQLREWQPCQRKGLKDSESIQMFYNQLFSLKKIRGRSDKTTYDFKQDEKELLVRLFHQLKAKDNYVTFDKVVSFFSRCKLYYLCYNIEPQQLLGILKDSAHQKSDRLSMNEFLNIFFADRPNIIHYAPLEANVIQRRCILSEQGWKELKTIFGTLDTFGNQTIHISPFIFKVKNNYSNRVLIYEPAIEFPQISRTISLKKVIFNIEFRYKIKDRVKWQDIEDIFYNYQHLEYPTIDRIFQSMVETGQINKFTNSFMLKPEIIEEIKKIYDRSPKYCDFFVKTQFICKELLQSLLIKKFLREAIVRIVQDGPKLKYIVLEEQIRILAATSEEFIDLDQLLEYFSIKGLLNSPIQTLTDPNQSSEEENQHRIRQIQKTRSLQKLKQLQKTNNKGYKPVRHLTVCQEFSLSQRKGQTIMERKTRTMKEATEQEIEKELQKKFKANPIPAQLNPQRYRAYLKKMQEQKQLRKQQMQKRRYQQNRVYQYLKTNTLLFTSKQKVKPIVVNQSYQYTAKPIPWHLADTQMLDKINQKKKLRRKKITTDAKIRILKQWKNLPDVAQEFSQPSENILHQLQSQEPSKSTKYKVKEVPNFSQLHRQFAESLLKKKKQWTATKPEEFHFSTYKIRKNTQEPNNAYPQLLKRIKSAETIKKSQSPHHKTSVQTYIVKQKVSIPTTVKHQQMCNFNQERLRSKLREQEKQRIQQINRKEKQRNFAKFMRKRLQRNLKKSQSLHNLTQSKIKKHKQNWKQLQKQNEEDLCRMYFSVMNRPFLFEHSSKMPIKSESINPQQKNRQKRRLEKSSQSKHIHQSPLKAYEPQNFDSKESFRFEPEPCEDEEGQQQYLNQSF